MRRAQDQSGIVISTVQDNECSGHAKVQLRQDCMVEAGHLNYCLVHVDGFRSKGVYLFEPMISTNDKDFLTAQIVSVSTGLFDLNVEHRGARLALELPSG